MSEKPNLLLIMCDQLRADVLGCYGNKSVKTPNIDRLAARGVCFDRAYSQTPVCVPARHGLIAGKHPFEIGLIDNSINVGEISNPLPELIRKQGYFTCAVGKMHFIPARKHYGFDRMFLSEEVPRHVQDDDYLQFLHEQGHGHVIQPHGKRSEEYYVPQISELPEDLHTSAWTANKTCEMIRKNRNRPFFIFSSFIKPHPPFDPSIPYDTLYPPDEVPMPIRKEEERYPDDLSIDIQNDYKVNGIENVSAEEMKKIRSYYYGCVTQVDKQIGTILDSLDENGLADNTLIILTADHGEMLGDHYSFGKRTFYEQSARIPMIVSWPCVLPQGEYRNHFAMLQDIYATFITASGGQVPEESSGKDMVEIGKNPGEPFREKVFAEFGQGRALKFMLRWDNYKYIYHTNGGVENLYNLKQDPVELDNVAAQHPEVCKNCQEELIAYYKSHGFEEALDGDRLKRYEHKKHVNRGFLNQYPRWPETVI